MLKMITFSVFSDYVYVSMVYMTTYYECHLPKIHQIITIILMVDEEI